MSPGDQQAVKTISHNLIVMKAGEVVESEPADEVFFKPTTSLYKKINACGILLT